MTYLLLLFFLCLSHQLHPSLCATNLTLDSRCGVSRGCYHDCTETGCSFLITWLYKEFVECIEFTMTMVVDSPYVSRWLAIGFSGDEFMGEDSVVQCITDDNQYTMADVTLSYNKERYNIDVMHNKYGLREMWGEMVDGRLSCGFSRSMLVHIPEVYSLDKPWYLLVANGYLYYGAKLRHSLSPGGTFVSPYTIDFKEHRNVNGEATHVSDVLIKIHGSLMIFAWVVLSSFSILLARFYKQQWPDSRACDRKVWFQVHKICMLTATVCVLAGFVVIWVRTNGYSQVVGGNSLQKAHPVLGVIIMSLTILNPVMGLLRPKSGNASRALFKYLHTFIGCTVYVLAIVNVILGITLPKTYAAPPTLWILVGFAGYQVVIETVLQVYECFLIRTGRVSDYEMKQMSAMRREMLDPVPDRPPGERLKTLIIIIHGLLVLGFGATSIVFLVL